jgi:hypothetical protein
MSEFVRFTLDDGSEVLFESAESDLVALHGGPPGRGAHGVAGVLMAAAYRAGNALWRSLPELPALVRA